MIAPVIVVFHEARQGALEFHGLKYFSSLTTFFIDRW